MAGIPLLSVINIAVGAIGLIPMFSDMFGSQDRAASVIKVTVGLDMEGCLSNAGRDLPDVRLFNEGGEFLGISADPGKIKDGSTATIKVKHKDDNTQQATYALFSANNNAICISALTITWPSGDEYAWLSNWGEACGGAWYYSNVYVKGTSHQPPLPVDRRQRRPAYPGFQIHWPEFVTKADVATPPPHATEEYLCNAGPPFKLYTHPDPLGITLWKKTNKRGGREITHSSAPPQPTASTPGAAAPPAPKPDLSTSPAPVSLPLPTPSHSRFADFLVVSQESKHSAKQLCESTTSAGPDFASEQEQLFCRMSDKTLWQFCNGEEVE
ncbi:hypothetical protein N0V88_000758 [Collariella sp. IMI 366227]|nr:hypothetical protein N0V88_000758 [Collariella sp. IMI 366227]